ncbi:MAG: Hsp20/alpha crystallin family protein [Thiobacillus sp.]|nr:Hsp20/alpha crystallin family protein [Thiobacillus sp.]
MSNIVRRDPFAMDELFDDLMKGYWVRPMRWPKELPDMQSIRMDMKEDEKTYTVHAEMPGVSKEDIQVTIDGNMVSISAEVKKTSEEKEGEKVLRSERFHGRMSRSFALDHEVDEKAANATFKDGVLELMLPKKAEAAARRVSVH